MKKSIEAISKFLSGKGFYVVMACCVAVVAIAGYIAYNRTAKILNEGLNSAAEDISVDYPQVNQTVSDILKPEAKADGENSSSVSEKASDAEAAPVQAEVKKPFAMPITGEVINPFSNGELVKSLTLGTWKTHDGIDIKADEGTPVYSVSTGTVSKIKEDGLWGVCAVIDHGNGIEAHYYGLSSGILVKTGDTVDIGQTIGTVGNTAECEIAEESHLHFGVKKDGEWVEPGSIMSVAE